MKIMGAGTSKYKENQKRWYVHTPLQQEFKSTQYCTALHGKNTNLINMHNSTTKQVLVHNALTKTVPLMYLALSL